MSILIKKSKERQNWENGTYAMVYLDHIHNKAIKICRKKPATITLGPQDTRFVLNDEISAYQAIWDNRKASANIELLRTLVPMYYGPCKIEAIIDTDEVDISEQFFLDCNFSMDLLKGESKKIRSYQIPDIHKRAFYNEKIYHIHDSSIVTDNNTNKYKYIDFRVGSIDDKDDLIDLMPFENLHS